MSRIMDFLFNFVLEFISFLDLYGDFTVLKILVEKRFLFTAVSSMIIMLAPFIVCLGPLINFLIERQKIRELNDNRFGMVVF